jgi:D-alanyl-D-alanine carboxypeptidase/D-alanyl-D-alanine-endopeptidase (penicillin-binding protein 4)
MRMRRWPLISIVGFFVLGASTSADAKPAASRRPRTAAARAILKPHRAVLETTIRDEGHNTAVAGDDTTRKLAGRLDGILGSSSLKAAVNGVYVVDVASGAELYAYGADRQLNPASNTKLVSTATAFDALGADFAYATRLIGPPADDDGVVHGDVKLVGESDPTLGPADLRDLAAHLAETGIRKITGDVIVSNDERDALAHAWITVTVIGGDKDGEHAHVRVSPDSGFYLVDNTARTVAQTGKKKKKAQISVDTSFVDGKGGERMRITVTGRVRPDQEVEVTRGVGRPALYAAHTLRSAIIAAGIEVGGGARQVKDRGGVGATDDDPFELARHESVPLARLAALINKPSNNFLADRLLLTVAAVTAGQRSMVAGVDAMAKWLGKVGIGPGSYRFENGSGLSHTIHISARQVAQVLLAGARDVNIGRAWIESLAIGGRDGTLRSRFAGHPVAGYVRGKTGTLNGVAALSGFVTVGERSICFSVLTNGFRDRRKPEVRAGQAAIVDAIFGYLAEAAPGDAAPALVPATDAPEPGVDSEDVAAPDDRLDSHAAYGNAGVEL